MQHYRYTQDEIFKKSEVIPNVSRAQPKSVELHPREKTVF
jgi:hypothetical protein